MNDKKFFDTFLILSLILVTLSFIIIQLSSPAINKKIVNVKEGNIIHKATVEKIDMAKLEKDYEDNFKRIFSQFAQLASEEKINKEIVGTIKNETLALKVPTKYKDLHIDFVLALVKMENYFSGGDNKEEAASLDAIKRIQENYLWLN